jgi:hypothetical protein
MRFYSGVLGHSSALACQVLSQLAMAFLSWRVVGSDSLDLQ